MINVFTMENDTARSKAQPNVTIVLQTITSAEMTIHHEKASLFLATIHIPVHKKNNSNPACEILVCGIADSANMQNTKDKSVIQPSA